MFSKVRPQSLHTLILLLGALCCTGSNDGDASVEATDEEPAPVSASEADSGSVANAEDGAPGSRPPGVVRAGIEVLLGDSLHLVQGLRVGVVTNHTGISVGPAGDTLHTIDRLAASDQLSLVAIYGPEHGYRGQAEAGEHVESGRDPVTDLPVHSLYGRTRKPTPAMLDGVEVLVFDIQDIGARYYTYVSTMALAMEAAGEAGIPFVVLDRPNPLRGPVQGNVLDPDFATFVGMYPVPMRHGMTPGELARLFTGEFGVDVRLHVVPADGWRRDMPFGETRLPWVAPSPNMPDTASALHYPGTCLFEGTNLSVGRGTERPFQQVGAPWLDGAELAERLNVRRLPGARFEAASFTPEQPGDGKYDGVEVHGVRFVATDASYDPTVAAVAALYEARGMAGDRWAWRESHFDRLAGTDRLRLALEARRSVDEIVAPWPAQLAEFTRLREPYLIYE